MTDLRALPIFWQALAIMAAVVLLVVILGRLRNALLALAGMVFFSSISVAMTWTGIEIRLWLYPLQATRSVFFLAFGVILLIAALVHTSSMSRRGIRGQGLILLIMGVYAGILRMAHETMVSGMETIAFVLLTVAPFLLIVQAVLDQEDDFLPLLRSLMLVNMAWVGAVAMQLVVNPSLMTGGKGARFIGLTGNPQNAGLTLAVMATITLWLLLNDPKRHLRPLWLALFTANVMLVIVTGSRTSAGTFAIGVMIATYGRLGRIILFLPVLLVVLFAAIQLASAVFVEFGEAAGRLGSLQDTRSGAWLVMLQDGMEHPWIGVGVVETESENSYLKALASYGMGMVAMTLLLVAVSMRLMWRLYRLRRWVAPYRRSQIDLVLAFNGMYFAASVFEGIMIARVALYLMLMLMFSVITYDLLERETEYPAVEGMDDEYEAYAAHPYEEESGHEYVEAEPRA